jgi:hypothetical protein
MAKATERDGVAEFWGIHETHGSEEAACRDSVSLNTDVPCFSLIDNDCLSETVDNFSVSDLGDVRIASITTPQAQIHRRPVACKISKGMSDCRAGLRLGVSSKYRGVLVLHVLLCFTLTAFLLLLSCCVAHKLTLVHVVYV